MKTSKILSAVLAAALIASSMAACSGDDGKTEKKNAPASSVTTTESTQVADGLAGKYTMTSYIKDGENVDLSDNNAKGIFTTINIKEDGSGEYDFFGIKSDVTVEGENITLAGSKSTYTLSGDA